MSDPAPQKRPRPSIGQARSTARLGAVQALYQMDVTGQDSEAALDEFLTHRLGAEIEGANYADADARFFKDIVRGVVGRQEEVDRALARFLMKGWPLERLDTTLRAALRAAAYELIARDDVPARVIVGEYTDIAAAFFGDSEETRFLNGVLDRMARTLRSDMGKGAEA